MKVGILALLVGCVRTGLPGRSFQGELPEADAELRASTSRLKHHVQVLAEDIGPRSFSSQPKALHRAATYITSEFEGLGYDVAHQEVVSRDGWTTSNLIVELEGFDPPLVVGAHYDSAVGTPGADDNASGVASLLEIARALTESELKRRVLLVAWTTEEPPFFRSRAQGSRVHAQSIETPFAAISLEMLGTFRDDKGSQRYPFPFSWFYPNRGDFVMFVSNPASNRLNRRVARTFRASEALPSRGASAPPWITGIDWSDHASYWEVGAPAIMVTDTSFNRNPNYHEATDTVEKLDYDRLARVTRGLVSVVRELSMEP